MGIGTWHILILVGSFISPIADIWTEKSDRRPYRRQFAKRFFGLWAAIVVVPIILDNALDGRANLIGVLFTLSISLLALVPIFRWLVKRARDAGMGETVI